MRPIAVGTKIVVRQEVLPETTEGGLVLPEQTKQEMRPLRGKAISVGPGDERNIPPVLEGATILFGPNAGLAVKVGDESLLVMDFTDVLCEVEA